MKKTLLFSVCLGLFTHLSAQTNIPGGNAPVKLSDVITAYKKMNPDYGSKNTKSSFIRSILPGLPKEENEKDYQFDRWLWYWRQHTDLNGYLVSPAKTLQEQQKAQLQAKNSPHAKTTSGVPSSWVFAGPDSSEAQGQGVGRINVVAFHPTDSNTFWIGTPGGGAWKTTNGGASWTCMTDQLPVLSISDIVFNPLNPNTVYLCTGDRDAGDYSGIGVLKSYDGGTTWDTTGMTWTPNEYNVANSMIINPQDTNSLVLATTAGIYQSHDGGTTFTLADTGDFKQVLYRPNDTNIVYATTYINYNNYPTINYAQIWRSANGGATWTQQTSLTTSVRVTLAVTPAAPNTVLAISAAYDATGSNTYGLDGIYKSWDTGKTYTEIYTGGCSGNLLTWAIRGNECSGQGWYTLPLAISPIDSNKVYTGGVNAWSSSDGGHTWSIVSEWDDEDTSIAVIHADKHWMAFNPLTPTKFFETNDGGIYSSYNPDSSGVWNNLTNRMGIEEIYRTSVAGIDNFAITGAQDVGTKLEWPGGINKEAVGGDGMACLLDYADSTIAYGSSEYGYINILDPTALYPLYTSSDIAGNIPGGVEGSGAWVTPYILEPSCHTCILAGYNSIYQSMDEGNTWSAISPALTTNNLSRVVTTIADSNTIFATEDYYGQNIYYTHDGGTTWTTLTAPYSPYELISDIKVDPRNKNHIWVTYSGYGSTQVAEWSSTDGWQQMKTGLPDVPIECFAIDYLSRDLYVGTEIGVYYRDSTMTSWAPFTTGLPSVEVTDLEINYTTNEIWAATYGRSLWKSPKHTNTTGDTTVTPSAVSIVPFVADGMTISPNPNHGNFTVTVHNIPDQQAAMRLVANDGRTIWQDNGTISAGKLYVNAPGLVPGTYIFELSSGGVIEGRQKVVVH